MESAADGGYICGGFNLMCVGLNCYGCNLLNTFLCKKGECIFYNKAVVLQSIRTTKVVNRYSEIISGFNLTWNAKGGILDGAQIFGMLGNSFLGGGEAGKEAVRWLNTYS